MSKNENNEELKLLPKRNPQEFFRKRIGELNNSPVEMDYHEGKSSKKDYTGYPAEYFTKPMTFKDKVDLVLEKKNISIEDFCFELAIKKEDAYTSTVEYIDNLSKYSGYPKEFFLAESFVDTAVKAHRKAVILSIILVIVIFGTLIGTFLYLINQ